MANVLADLLHQGKHVQVGARLQRGCRGALAEKVQGRACRGGEKDVGRHIRARAVVLTVVNLDRMTGHHSICLRM